VIDSIYPASTWILPVLLAITLHEAAHGWAAWRLGDDTALRLGRVSFNPLRHVDPFGTVLLPAMLLLASGGQMMFGFAKPVPVDFSRLRPFRLGLILVAVAGPFTNILLLFGGAALLGLLPHGEGMATAWIAQNLVLLAYFNALLAVFNMLPLPPLDGGRVLVGILPRPLAVRVARLERKGILILIALIFVIPWVAGKLGSNFDPFDWLVWGPATALTDAVMGLFLPR
jgi:Zn-dependent protease